jgi:cytochrome c556
MARAALSAERLRHLRQGRLGARERLSLDRPKGDGPARPLASTGERPMKQRWVGAVVLGAFVVGLGGGVLAQDKEAAVKERREFMKSMAKRMAVVKAYTEGKADLGAATQSVQELAQSVPQISSHFPVDTSMANFPGKSGARPSIWTDWSNFLTKQQGLDDQVGKLNLVMKEGDKDKIAAQFGNVGKQGCGGCHETYRVKLDN